MLSTLLNTKLHRPRPSSKLVTRPRLTQRLDEGLRNGHRLFLVVAPPGYGKTTLVTDWLDRTDIPSAWLSLDEADNDPIRFFAYVAAALQKALGPKLSLPLPDAFPMAPQSPEALVAALVNDLAALDRPVLVALDDYHLITAGPVQETVAFLLRRGPPNLHLIVLSRVDPPFPLPRLRVREQMTEIRDRDLRFTPEEMTAFLGSLHRLSLTAEQIAALELRTEGWAAGVQLAALSLQGRSAEYAAEFISAFSGSHHYIVDYLFEEVLSRQPDAVRAFLLQTSILDRMCAPLCDALLSREARGPGGTDGEQHTVPSALEILSSLDRSNLFLVPLDDTRWWYRYHHLFVDVLRQMHRSASGPEQVSALHARASDWYRQNGFVAEAFRHALQAGGHESAAEIVEENAWSMVLQGELTTLTKWIRALPSESVSAHPWLRIYYAWALLFADSEAAETQLKAVEEQLQAGDRMTLPAEMQGHIAAIRAWIANLRGDSERMVVLSRQALDLCPQVDAAVHAGLMAILGDGCMARNDLLGGEHAFAEVVELAQSSGYLMLEVAARTSLGHVEELRGHLHEAEAIFQEALQRALLHKSPAAAQAYFHLAAVYREWNDLASARMYAEKLVESSALWGVVSALACGHLSLAVVLQALGDTPGAKRAMAEAGQLMRQHPHELRSMPWLGATQARLWLAHGKLEDARRWAETRGLSAEGQFDLSNELEYRALVRILLAEGRQEEAANLLTRLQREMESTGRQGSLITVLVLGAIAMDLRAETGSALAKLEQAVSLARAAGYMRVFLDEGTPMQRLLGIASTQWKDRDLLAYTRQLLAAFAGESVEPATGQAPHAGVLSERELEVLHLMADGCSNQEIASHLVIAIGTAKRHVANIFDKLDVRNRTEAVAAARQLDLL